MKLSSCGQIPALRLLTELGWTAEVVAQMPREVYHPFPAELLLSLREDESKLFQARPLITIQLRK